MTTGAPRAAISSATRSARNFDALYGPTMSASDTGVDSSPAEPSAGMPSAPTVDVYTMRSAPASAAARSTWRVPSTLAR